MTVRVGINGFGRISRTFLRAARTNGADIEIVAVNDLGEAQTMAHLLRFDSIYGPFAEESGSTTARCASARTISHS